MTDLRLQIAQDLHSIEDMFARLRAEAVNRAGDPDMPGGAAMVLLGPGVDVEAFGYMQISAALGRINADAVEEVLRSDLEPPLSFLASWTDIIREERGQEPSSNRASIRTEADYIRSALDWMTAFDEDGAPWWLPVEDFAEQLSRVRRALENVLKSGDRLTRIRARCMYCDQEPRLARQYVEGQKDDGKDFWFCPNRTCNHVYDAAGVQRIWEYRAHLDGTDEWILLTEAARISKRSVKTLRTWCEAKVPYAPKVRSTGSRLGDRINVWWPDVRAANDTSARRDRSTAA